MTNFQGVVFDLPMTASGDLNSYQYYFVKGASTAGRVDAATGASGPHVLGVLQNDPRSLEEATVRILGTSKVYFSSSTALGYMDLVSSGSAGAGEAQSGSRPAVGYALENVVAGTGYAEVLLSPVIPIITDNTP